MKMAILERGQGLGTERPWWKFSG